MEYRNGVEQIADIDCLQSEYAKDIKYHCGYILL